MLKSKTLQFFAEEVEVALQKGGTSLVLQVCRHIIGDDRKVAAFMTAKLVEWGLGKAKETVELSGTVEHEHRTITERLTDDELAKVEALIESAKSRGNKG